MKSHTFRGIRYRVAADQKIDGYAEVPVGREPKTIYVDPTLPPLRHLEIALHEALHAEDPKKPERVVERQGKSLARWLWRMGYRRVNQ